MNPAIRCPQCKTTWLVQGVEEGQSLTCPACAASFSYRRPAEQTVRLKASDVLGKTKSAAADIEGGGEWGDLELPSRQRITLEVLNGPQKGLAVELKENPVTLGRGFGGIGAADEEVSRIHASLEIYGDRAVVLRDIASTNGTFVNEKLVSSACLRHGDTIRIGERQWKLRVEPKAR